LDIPVDTWHQLSTGYWEWLVRIDWTVAILVHRDQLYYSIPILVHYRHSFSSFSMSSWTSISSNMCSVSAEIK
jgi:hypothetical protein